MSVTDVFYTFSFHFLTSLFLRKARCCLVNNTGSFMSKSRKAQGFAALLIVKEIQ